MKKFLIIIFLFITLNLFSQNFNGGLILGIAATQISGDQLGGYDKLGLNLGTFVNLNTGKYSSMQMELKFIQKGSKSKLSIFDTSIVNLYRLRLNYIELPITFRYSLKAFSKYQSDSTFRLLNRLSAEAGIAYAQLLSSNEEDLTQTFTLYTPPFHKFDLSIVLGLYFSVNKNFKIGFRRTKSILPVRPHSSNPEPVAGSGQRLNMGQYNDVAELSFHFQINRIKE